LQLVKQRFTRFGIQGFAQGKSKSVNSKSFVYRCLKRKFPLFHPAGSAKRWKSVDKSQAGRFSSKNRGFPQVFHTEMWTEMASNNGKMGGFFTYSQPLLLLLVLD
jgi:hypothetical protein